MDSRIGPEKADLQLMRMVKHWNKGRSTYIVILTKMDKVLKHFLQRIQPLKHFFTSLYTNIVLVIHCGGGNWMSHSGLPYLSLLFSLMIVFPQVASMDLRMAQVAIKQALAKEGWDPLPQLIDTSAKSKEGRDQLWLCLGSAIGICA